MSFNFIYNPLTNEKYSIFSYEGKSLLKQYIKEYQTGGTGGMKPEFAVGTRGNVTFTDQQRRDYLLEQASTKAAIDAVLQKTRSKKTQKTQKAQKTEKEKKCSGLKRQIQEAQSKYYVNCSDGYQEEVKQANEKIENFTGI